MSELPDRCPDCAAAKPSPALAVLPVPAGGVRADYRCAECGCEWFTCWNEAATTKEGAA
jgi:hypothetical protein